MWATTSSAQARLARVSHTGRPLGRRPPPPAAYRSSSPSCTCSAPSPAWPTRHCCGERPARRRAAVSIPHAESDRSACTGRGATRIRGRNADHVAQPAAPFSCNAEQRSAEQRGAERISTPLGPSDRASTGAGAAQAPATGCLSRRAARRPRARRFSSPGAAQASPMVCRLSAHRLREGCGERCGGVGCPG
jgi:hypothetical protein